MSAETEDLNRRLLRARDAMDRAYAEPLDIPAVAAVALVAGWFAAPGVTFAVIIFLGLIVQALTCWFTVRWVLSWRHRRRWLRPLHLAAHEIAGVDRRRAPHQWIQVEPDRTKAVLALPAGFPAEQKDKDRLVEIAKAKLGMHEADPEWRLAGPKPQLTLLPSAAPPPPLIRYEDLAEAVARAGPDEWIAGIGKKGSVVKASLATDSPHVAINMGTGAGKSSLAAFWLMQELRRGAIAMVLDSKWHSHPWLFKDEQG